MATGKIEQIYNKSGAITILNDSITITTMNAYKRAGICCINLYFNVNEKITSYTAIFSLPDEFKPVAENQIIIIKYSDKTAYSAFLSTDGTIRTRSELEKSAPYIMHLVYLAK